MKKRWLGIVFTGLILFPFALQIQGGTIIGDILTKGSRWTLTVDGETGTLELLGGQSAATPGGGWVIGMEVKWLDTGGILRAKANSDNSEQSIALNLHKQNGDLVICEGYINQENNESMSGTTKYPNRAETPQGTWHASLIKNDKTTTGRRDIKLADGRELRRDKNIVVVKEKRDKEAPTVEIAVDGILVFTLNDKIKIRGSAEDNEKIAKITIYIDNQPVKTCTAWECHYSEILTKPGSHTCWADAEDTAGNKGQSKTLEFMVHPTAKPGPALNTKIQPYSPTSQDKITFIASASHSSGVASITFFIAGQEIKTCSGDTCQYVGGPYTGNITWRVSATAKDGGVTYGKDTIIEIKPLNIGTCSITGKVFGPGAYAAKVFFVILYGPNDFKVFREKKNFDASGVYQFTGLPNGQYKLVVTTKADIAVGPHPYFRIAECNGGTVTDMDFELK